MEAKRQKGKKTAWVSIRGDQGRNRRTDQPGRKCHPGGEK